MWQFNPDMPSFARWVQTVKDAHNPTTGCLLIETCTNQAKREGIHEACLPDWMNTLWPTAIPVKWAVQAAASRLFEQEKSPITMRDTVNNDINSKDPYLKPSTLLGRFLLSDATRWLSSASSLLSASSAAWAAALLVLSEPTWGLLPAAGLDRAVAACPWDTYCPSGLCCWACLAEPSERAGTFSLRDLWCRVVAATYNRTLLNHVHVQSPVQQLPCSTVQEHYLRTSGTFFFFLCLRWSDRHHMTCV